MLSTKGHCLGGNACPRLRTPSGMKSRGMARDLGKRGFEALLAATSGRVDD